jgi:hypothetical protein
MFHIELRQFPTTSRAFNLSAEDIHRRFVEPWIAGEKIQLDEHRFSAEKAKLKIYEGRELRPDEMGFGRGWGNVTRTGADVTDRVLEQAVAQSAPTIREQAIRELKAQLLVRAARAPVSFPEAMALSGDGQVGWRVSERMGVAEQAVWELLHADGLRLTRDGTEVPKPEWEGLVLAWETWRDAGPLSLRAGESDSA